MIATAVVFSMYVIGLALVMSLWRLLRGPTLPDRILGLDTLYINTIALLVLMVLPGTPGPNRFGPDPKDPANAAVFA